MSLMEHDVNTLLASTLASRRSRWQVSSQQTQMIQGAGGKAMDLLIQVSGRQSIAVENKIAPQTAERDAIGRLGLVLAGSNESINTALELQTPASVRRYSSIDEFELDLASTEFPYCLHRLKSNGAVGRFPNRGYIRGNLVDLALTIENAGFPEERAFAID